MFNLENSILLSITHEPNTRFVFIKEYINILIGEGTMASVAQYCQRLRQCVDAQDVSTLTKMLSLNISIRSIQGALAEV